MKLPIRVATIIRKDNTILLVLSKYEDGNYYLFPGGGLENSETLEECAIRETAEETGYLVKLNDLVHVNEYWNNNKRSLSFFFNAEIISISDSSLLSDGGKIIKTEWVDISKLSQIDVRPKQLAKNIIDTTERLNFSLYKNETENNIF